MLSWLVSSLSTGLVAVAAGRHARRRQHVLRAGLLVGLTAFADLVAASHWPVVAIGGIQVGDCLPLLQAGAKGVAVVSAICGQDDPALATRTLRDEIRSVVG